MEFIQKNIHMDKVERCGEIKFSLEEDFNISDVKDDVDKIVYQKGEVKIEEIKENSDACMVRGCLFFDILYQSEQDGSLVHFDNKIMFEEKLYGCHVNDIKEVRANSRIMDLSTHIINSRKLNVQSVIGIELVEQQLYDESVSQDVEQPLAMEYRKKSLETLQVAVWKKDVFRFKEEISIPAGTPNIYELLWSQWDVRSMEFKCLDNKINLQGEAAFFCIYKEENDEQTVKMMDTTIPFSAMIDCQGCGEGMIPEIDYEVVHKNIDVREDLDGEDRVIGMECTLDLFIKLLEEEPLEILADAYGVTKEVETESEEKYFPKLLMRGGGKVKYVEKFEECEHDIGRIVHSTGEVWIDQMSIENETLSIQATLYGKVFYEYEDGKLCYGWIGEMFPIEYSIEVPGLSDTNLVRITPMIEEISSSLSGKNQIEMKVFLYFKGLFLTTIKEEVITDMKVTNMDAVKRKNLPGMAVYIAREGDSLWNIGKKYYIPVSRLKEINHLNSEQIRPGDKLLIVKGK